MIHQIEPDTELAPTAAGWRRSSNTILIPKTLILDLRHGEEEQLAAMAKKISARKYPATFRSVIGQNSLTTTLKNAIITRHLAHDYLFCGPRGVGKTTCARIFAKTINYSNITEEGEACNQCESCVSFNENRSLNIFERRLPCARPKCSIKT